MMRAKLFTGLYNASNYGYEDVLDDPRKKEHS